MVVRRHAAIDGAGLSARLTVGTLAAALGITKTVWEEKHVLVTPSVLTHRACGRPGLRRTCARPDHHRRVVEHKGAASARAQARHARTQDHRAFGDGYDQAVLQHGKAAALRRLHSQDREAAR